MYYIRPKFRFKSVEFACKRS